MRIYVEFDAEDAAKKGNTDSPRFCSAHSLSYKAVNDLNGRFFGGRTVGARLYDQELLNTNKLGYNHFFT